MTQMAGRESTRKPIHLIFKTHLDIGFTDYAANVRKQYHDHFLPLAVATGEHFWRENPETPKFIWTTGAWLIHEYLEKAPPEGRKKLERAIERGLIAWHAMPYTTHTELLSAALFDAGLGYCRDLDEKFHRRTTAAKMTDVPGHTIGIVPLLAKAGVRFLHIGVNAASTSPDVPPVFRWRVPEGDEIVVMYQSDYGATYFPDNLDQGIGFAHTQDNVGPQSIAQVVEVHRMMAEEHPDSEITSSNLTDYGNLLWDKRERFPVVTQEIGDSWIHGVGTAPAKVSRFMGLRRLYGNWASKDISPQRKKMGRALGMIAEHTWGVDIKTFLRDETAWDRVDFAAAREKDPRFALTEKSWNEQNALIDHALSYLNFSDRVDAEKLAALNLSAQLSTKVSQKSRKSLGQGSLDFDPDSGGLRGILFPNGEHLDAGLGNLAALSYQSYDAKDINDHKDSYLTQRVYWSEQDQGKPGLERAETAFSGAFWPEWQGVGDVSRGTAVSKFTFPEQASEELGAPHHVEIRYEFVDSATLEVMVCYYDKPANRMPEASFLTFDPVVDPISWRFKKLGYLVDPKGVIHNGNRQLHAVQSVICETHSGQVLTITPLDSPLVGPAEAPFHTFYRGDIKMESGVRFCLHNNKWGTNFPMWCEGDLVFRFQLKLLAK
jgi:hypothetical protein